MQNTTRTEVSDVPGRIAQQTLQKRNAQYESEVRRLLDAALDLMRTRGTASRPRVADIVAAAGLSNDAFYRHFASKEALVAAVLEDGSERLHRYLEHQMSKETTPAGKVRRWVEGVLAQADEEVAATTVAVLWNGGSIGRGPATGRHHASGPLSVLLREPFAALGSGDPTLDASLAAHATFGKLSDYLFEDAPVEDAPVGHPRPTRSEIDRIVDFCLAGAERGAALAPRQTSEYGRMTGHHR